MGGGISVVAVETRMQMDSSGRCVLVETAHPLHLGGGALGGGGPGGRAQLSFRPSTSRMLRDPGGGGGGTDDSDDDDLVGSMSLGPPPLLLGSFTSSRFGGEGRMLGGSANGSTSFGILEPVLGGSFGSAGRNGRRGLDLFPPSSQRARATQASGERIILLAEALFRMLEEMEGQLAAHQEPKGPRPAPAAIIDCLPTRKYGKQPVCGKGKAKEDCVEECYVCLADYESGDTLRTLPCKHEFHAHCVDKWLKEVHNVCPLCRTPVGDTRESVARGMERERAEHVHNTEPPRAGSLLARRAASSASPDGPTRRSDGSFSPAGRDPRAHRASPTTSLNAGPGPSSSSHSLSCSSSPRSGAELPLAQLRRPITPLSPSTPSPSGGGGGFSSASASASSSPGASSSYSRHTLNPLPTSERATTPLASPGVSGSIPASRSTTSIRRLSTHRLPPPHPLPSPLRSPSTPPPPTPFVQPSLFASASSSGAALRRPAAVDPLSALPHHQDWAD